MMDQPVPPEKIDLSVLYVEDEDTIRESLSRILRRRTRELHVADNGQVGLEKYREFAPDVIVTDIRMPVLGGLKMSREIRKDNPNIPIVVTTAFTDTEHFLEAIEIGISRFILKPVDTDKIIQVLQESAEVLNAHKELEKKNKLLDEYQKAVDASAAVSKTDTQGKITYVNQHFCELSGYAEEELVGQPHDIIRHPNEKKEKFDELWATISEKKIWSGVLENLRKDGKSFFVDLDVVPILNEHEEVQEYIGLFTDITSLIEKERELEHMRLQQMKQSLERATDIRLNDIVDNIPIPAVILNENDLILCHNKSFERLFDMFEDKEVLGSLKNTELLLHTLFQDEEGCLKHDELMDWKSVASDLQEVDLSKVKLHTGEGDKLFQIHAQKLEKMGDETRYIVCMNEIGE